ncbi:hypothetical protein [Sphingobium sp. Z007]|uniref:hypothetical protein n=1 Tax=Sphingobium sp. Z007 TaxID=627495 RepID=UPI000B49AA05|nr:hypothetical protein [Sphingobium sp. Z007]
MAPTLAKPALTALLALSAALTSPGLAQQTPDAPPPEAPPVEEAAPAAPAPVARDLTSAEIAAFNAAVTDFTAGQAAQQKGDNAGAVAKYDAALPAIRTAVEADPAKGDNVNFLANALYADAAAYGALGQIDKVIALYAESLPHWRKVVEAKPADAASRNILAGILIQMGNQALRDHDRGAADPHYEEALTLARQTVTDQPGDAISKNVLLSALIGASQTSTEEGLRDEAISMGKAMMADGTIDAMNKPSIETMTGPAGTVG